MVIVGATEFKARCLDSMARVARDRTTYVITKRGKPVAKLVPAKPPIQKNPFGCLTDRTLFVGGIEKPLWTEKEWKAFDRRRGRHWRASHPGSRKPSRISGDLDLARNLAGSLPG